MTFPKFISSKIPWRVKRCLPGFVKCLKLHLNIILSSSACHPSPFMIWFPAHVPSFNFYHSRSWTSHSIKAEFVSQDMNLPLWTFVLTHIPSLHGTRTKQTLRHFERCLHTSRGTLMPPPRLGNYSWTLTQWCWFVLCPSPIAIWES